MALPRTDTWTSWWGSIDGFAGALRKSKAINVNSTALRDGAKQVVQEYFREVRPELFRLNLPEENIGTLDELLQRLLELANGRNSKTSYLKVFRDLRKQGPAVEFERELLLGKRVASEDDPTLTATQLEEAILKTLSGLVPSAALSYEQAIRDLADADRVSARGTASEIREALREVLDHLAPDSDVKNSEGFKLEKGRDRPTMKQKVRFILRSRGLSRTSIASPEAAVERITSGTDSLARSLYDRGSLDTHVTTSRREVKQLKLYVDGVFAELLEIHV